MALGDPPIRPPAPPVNPNDPEFVLKPTNTPGIYRDQHGRLHNKRCSYCNDATPICMHCFKGFKPGFILMPETEFCPFCGITAENICYEPPVDICERAIDLVLP